MEIKKAKRFDLERSRPLRLALSFSSIVIVCALIMSMPIIISSVMKNIDKWDDEIIEDLKFDLREEDEMIAAVQTEVQDEVTEIIKPVETITEAEELESTDIEATKEEIAEKESEDEPAEAEEMKEAKDAKPIDRSDPEDLEIAETLPEFPGGMSEYVTWLTRNLKYPAAAQSRKIQGSVSISFVIEKDGSLTDIKVAKTSTYALLDNEALRVAKLMPKWKPGKQKGKPCRTLFAVTIEFKL